MPRAAKTFGGKRKQPDKGERIYGAAHRQRRAACFLLAGYICETPNCGRLCAVADHIIPHEGNVELFHDETNYQALCEWCHDVKTRAENRARMLGKRLRPGEWIEKAEHLG